MGLVKLFLTLLTLSNVDTNGAQDEQKPVQTCLLSKDRITYRCKEYSVHKFDCHHEVTLYQPIIKNNTDKYLIAYSIDLCTARMNESCTKIDPSWKTITCPHLPVRPAVVCYIPSYYISSLYANYALIVEASGLGCETSFTKAQFQFSPNENIIPLPPQNITVGVIKKREVSFSWNGPPSAHAHSEEYIITYHSEYDRKNETADCNIKTNCSVSNLHAGAQYWFWFILSLLDIDHSSHPAGPIHLVTLPDVPSEPPGIHYKLHNVNKEKRNLVITVELPEKFKRNGHISKLEVFFCETTDRFNSTCEQTKIKEKSVQVTTSSTNITVENLTREFFFIFWIRMCTDGGGCIDSSHSIVQSNPWGDSTQKKSPSIITNVSKIVIIVAVVLAVLIIIVIMLFIRKRRQGMEPGYNGLDILRPDERDNGGYENENVEEQEYA